jgi:hypothetical protein
VSSFPDVDAGHSGLGLFAEPFPLVYADLADEVAQALTGAVIKPWAAWAVVDGA